MARVFDTRSTSGMTVGGGTSNPLSLNTYGGYVFYHLKIFVNEVAGCTWDTSGFTPGSGYTDGTYNGVELRRADTSYFAGRDLTADLVVSGGVVTSVTIVDTGNGFIDTDTVIIHPATAPVGLDIDGGFEMACTGGTADLGIIYGPDQTTSSSTSKYRILIGGNRVNNDWTLWQLWYQSTSTFYNYHLFFWNPSSSEDGYGSMGTSNRSVSTARWDSGSQWNLFIRYSTEPGEYYFTFGDDEYQTSCGFFLADQTYIQNPMARSISSNWVNFVPDGRYWTWSNREYDTPLFGESNTSIFFGAPSDYGVFWGGERLRSRSIFIGTLPPFIAIKDETEGWPIDSHVDDLSGTHVWKFIDDAMVVRWPV